MTDKPNVGRMTKVLNLPFAREFNAAVRRPSRWVEGCFLRKIPATMLRAFWAHCFAPALHRTKVRLRDVASTASQTALKHSALDRGLP
jgi:hypothetical protein